MIERHLPRGHAWLGLVIIVAAIGCGGAQDPESGAGAEAADACGNRADTVARIDCYVDLATREGHPRACREVDEDEIRYPCFAVLAERLREASLCDDIPASNDQTRRLRDGCLGDVAAVIEQSTLCERIFDATLRDGCFGRIAHSTGNTTLCASITDAGSRDACAATAEAIE